MGYPGTCAVRKNLCYEAPNWANNSCPGSGKPANVRKGKFFKKNQYSLYACVSECTKVCEGFRQQIKILLWEGEVVLGQIKGSAWKD